MDLPANTIFLCYRRDDSADVTGRLFDRLEGAFPNGVVFRDVDTIPLGVDFRDHVKDALGGCRVVFVMIGPGWLEAKEAKGNARLTNPRDHVRIEIEHALARKGLRVIPVLVGGAKMPDPEVLPDSLQNLAYLNAAEVRRDPDFRMDADRLIKHVKKILETPVAAPPVAESSEAVKHEEAAKAKEYHVVVEEIAGDQIRTESGAPKEEADISDATSKGGTDGHPSLKEAANAEVKPAKVSLDLMGLEKDVAGMDPGMEPFRGPDQSKAAAGRGRAEPLSTAARLRIVGGLVGLSAFVILALLFCLRTWQMLMGQLPYVTSGYGLLHYLTPGVLSLLVLLVFLKWSFRPFKVAVREGAAIPRGAWWGLLAVAYALVVCIIMLGLVDHEKLFVVGDEMELEFVGMGVGLLALWFGVRPGKAGQEAVPPRVGKRIWRAMRWPVQFVAAALVLAVPLPVIYEFWNTTPEFEWNEEESRLILRSRVTSLDGFEQVFENLQPVNVECLYMSDLQDVKALTVLTKVERLDLSDSYALEDLTPLERMQTVRELNLGGCIKIKSVAPLKGLTSLEVLLLTHGNLGSLDGLEQLSALPKLRELSLRGIEEVETLDALKGFAVLRRLNLEYCTGLRDVSGILHMKEMEFIDLNQCVSLPAKALSDLRKAMPGALLFLPDGGSSSAGQ